VLGGVVGAIEEAPRVERCSPDERSDIRERLPRMSLRSCGLRSTVAAPGRRRCAIQFFKNAVGRYHLEQKLFVRGKALSIAPVQFLMSRNCGIFNPLDCRLNPVAKFVTRTPELPECCCVLDDREQACLRLFEPAFQLFTDAVLNHDEPPSYLG
jgi:hypothetical protein